MILGSHNSWSYLPTKKWWMKLISFTAKCQNIDICKQYAEGVRCFDLRIRFTKEGKPLLTHGIIEYNYSLFDVFVDLDWLNNKNEQIFIRVIHETRTKKQYTKESVSYFIDFAKSIQNNFTNLKFWCGRNLYNWNTDYDFKFDPTCEEKYASVRSPKLIDDWWPWLYARLNNKKIIKEGTDKDILLIDFVNYGH